jgi:hypothetical protein
MHRRHDKLAERLCRTGLLLRPVAADNAAMEAEPTKAEPSMGKRRRLQFSLRTLLVILTIVAFQFAVCLPMLREWQSRRERTHSLVERLKGLVIITGGYRNSRPLSAGAAPSAASKWNDMMNGR